MKALWNCDREKILPNSNRHATLQTNDARRSCQPLVPLRATLRTMATSERGPLLAGWISVRVGRMSRTKRRYVLLRRDLVLEVASQHVPVVGAHVVPLPRERALRVRAHNTVALRLVLDTQFQFAKWNDAFQTAALWEMQRFYSLSEDEPIARGRFSLIRPATLLPSRLRVGPCPPVYTPRLDHFFVPCATNAAFAPADGNSSNDDDDDVPRRIRASVSEHRNYTPWLGATSATTADESEAEPASASMGQITSVTAVSSGFGDSSSPGAVQEPTATARARLSFGSFRPNALAKVAKSTLPRTVRRRSSLLDDRDTAARENVMPASYNAAQLLRVQTGFSPALRASLEGGEYRGCAQVVVKSVTRDGLGCAVAASEALVAHAHLRHHALVRVLDVFETSVVVHSVLERLEGPTLRAHLAARGGAPLDERVAARACRTLLKAVGYLHACGIVHWDIRADNVVLVGGKENMPKLFDFGSARAVDPYTGVLRDDDALLAERRPLPCTSAAAPEMLAAKAHHYAPKTDMWQMGCLLYTMLVGRSPFERAVTISKQPTKLFRGSAKVAARDASTMALELPKRRSKFHRNAADDAIRKAIFEFCKLRASARHAYLFALDNTAGVSVGAHARQLVAQLLTPNPRMRPNALACLQNAPFLQNVN